MADDKPDRPDARDAPRVVARDRASRTSSSSTARAGRSCATSTSSCPADRWSRWSAAAAPARRRSRTSSRGSTIRRAGASCSTAPTSATSGCAPYRDLLAIVQQDVFLFDGSVRDNIAYGRHDATDAEVEDAARRANAHEFIDQAARAVRDVHRRARREAVGRPAAAAGDRAGDPGVAADPDPRRGDEQPRHRERAADPGVDGRRCSPAGRRSSSRTGCPRSAAPI